MKPQEFFARRPVFTHDEFAAALAGKDRTRRTRSTLLAYYVRTGRLLNVRRGLYANVPPGSDPARYPVDPYLLAGRLAEDAVLAYHTALQFHGRAHSNLEHFTYLTARRSRPFKFRGQRFRAVPFPKALRRRHRELENVATADRLGVTVRVTTLERTLVDLLDRPVLGGGWEEIWRSLESVEFFDLDRVVEYALLLGNATTTAKVGYYLQTHRGPLMVTDEHLARLRKHRPRAPHYLDRDAGGATRLASEWNLVVPVEIAERAWEESP